MTKQAIHLIISLLLVFTVSSNLSGQTNSLHAHLGSYQEELETKYKDDHLTIHMLTHSHDDVGWIKTVDQYYIGSNQRARLGEVKNVIDTTIQQLLKDKTKKFTYVEMKFFSMWWYRQTEELKAKVRTMVQNGQIEFANGGWSMHDEACTHYDDMVNNMMMGHDFLMKEFGIKPKIGWHIDPFGHSNANPRLFADMGFDAWFFVRFDYQDKHIRMDSKALQWIQRPFYEQLGKNAEIFTGALYSFYCWPTGFEMDSEFETDDPIVDDESLSTYNADVKAKTLYDYAMKARDHFQGNHIMIPMGCDFAYANADMNFQSMDKLIRAFNKKYTNMTAQYSTLSDFLGSLHSQNITWPTRYNDMFPYSDQAEDYWTGYYTSRANSKKQVRDGQANLLASQKLYAQKVIDQQASQQTLAEINRTSQAMLDIMGVYQHHDAVAGTARQYVANDYTNSLFKAMQKNNAVFTSLVDDAFSSISSGYKATEWSWCYSLNGTYLDCPIANHTNTSHIVSIYNPSSLKYEHVRMKVPHGHYSVFTTNGSFNDLVQINDVAVFCSNRTVPAGYAVNDCEIHVKININQGDFQFLVLKYDKSVNVEVRPSTKALSISNSHESIKFVNSNSVDGLIFEISKAGLNEKHTVSFDLRYYRADQGSGNYTDSDNCPSGAYIFKPQHDDQFSHSYSQLKNITKYDGGFVQEIHIEYEDKVKRENAYVRVRLVESQQVSVWDAILGGIPLTDQGKEVILSWKSHDIDNEGVFYTDSNGLEMQKRVRNDRPDFNMTTHMNVSSNYYPINSAIAIRDKKSGVQMTVMNDRSQGGSSIYNGQIELMQNRRLYLDDFRGLDEQLNETDSFGNGITVPATYYLQIFNSRKHQSVQRQTQLQIDEPLQLFFAFNWTDTNRLASSSSSKLLNSNLNILDFQSQDIDEAVEGKQSAPIKLALFARDQNKILARFSNIGDFFDLEQQNSSKGTVFVDVKAFAQQLWTTVNGDYPLNNINIVEMSINGNQPYTDVVKNKKTWKTIDDGTEKDAEGLQEYPKDKPDFKVALNPQRIRTFVIEYVPLRVGAGATEFEQN